jgi:hypothetical protein
MPPETLDSLDKDSLKSLVLQLVAQNNELLQQIKTLLARIAELEARAGQPTNRRRRASLALLVCPAGRTNYHGLSPREQRSCSE